jgi:hypothetical protein
LRQAPVGIAAAFWLRAVTVALANRSVLPIDETRYLAVAWEIWSRGNFVLPTLNGEAYSHKPPLLYWIIHAGWAAFGVNEWWPHLVALACLSAALVMKVPLVARPALAVVMDLGPLSIHLGVWEREGCYGAYHGQFHFLGQLSKPLAIIGDGGVAEWVRLNPRGEIVTYHRRVPARARPDFVQPFRAMTIGVWDAALVGTDLTLVRRPE